jgi:hypothetical protein
MASLVALAAGWLFVGIGLLSVAKGVGPLRTGLRLRSGSTDIAEAEGRASVEGVARVRDDPVASPLSGDGVLAFEYGVSLGSDGEWQWVMGERDAVPFVVEDETGRAVVDVDGAEIDLTPETDFYDGSDDLPAEYRERFGQHAAAAGDPDRETPASVDPSIAGGRFATSKWIRVDRQELRPGDDVVVTGQVEREGQGPGCRLTNAQLAHRAPKSAVRRLLRRGAVRAVVGLGFVAVAVTAFAVVP